MSNERDSGRPEADSSYEISGEEAASIAVIEAVAESTGRSAFDLEPLSEAIDPDALDKLCAGGAESTPPVSITFEYCGRDVTVTSSVVRVTQ